MKQNTKDNLAVAGILIAIVIISVIFTFITVDWNVPNTLDEVIDSKEGRLQCNPYVEIWKTGEMFIIDEYDYKIKDKGIIDDIFGIGEFVDGDVQGYDYKIDLQLLLELHNNSAFPIICDFAYMLEYNYNPPETNELCELGQTPSNKGLEFADARIICCVENYCSDLGFIDYYANCTCVEPEDENLTRYVRLNLSNVPDDSNMTFNLSRERHENATDLDEPFDAYSEDHECKTKEELESKCLAYRTVCGFEYDKNGKEFTCIGSYDCYSGDKFTLFEYNNCDIYYSRIIWETM